MVTEITIDVAATVSGRGDECDYGVTRSPKWTEVCNISLGSQISVNGKRIPEGTALHAELSALIIAEAYNVPADEWDE